MKLTFAFVLFALSIFAQQSDPLKDEAKVSVSVTCRTEAKEMVESYIKPRASQFEGCDSIVDVGELHIGLI